MSAWVRSRRHETSVVGPLSAISGHGTGAREPASRFTHDLVTRPRYGIADNGPSWSPSSSLLNHRNSRAVVSQFEKGSWRSIFAMPASTPSASSWHSIRPLCAISGVAPSRGLNPNLPILRQPPTGLLAVDVRTLGQSTVEPRAVSCRFRH